MSWGKTDSCKFPWKNISPKPQKNLKKNPNSNLRCIFILNLQNFEDICPKGCLTFPDVCSKKPPVPLPRHCFTRIACWSTTSVTWDGMGSLEGWREWKVDDMWKETKFLKNHPPSWHCLREISSPKSIVVLGFNVTFPDAPCHSTSQCWSCLTFDNAFVFCLLANMAWSMHMPNSRWHEMELTYGLQMFQQNPGSVEI